MLRPRAAAAGTGAGANPYYPPNSTSDKDEDITTSHSYLTNVRTSNKSSNSSSSNSSKVTSSNSSKNNLPRNSIDGWSNHKKSLFRSMIKYGIMVIGMFVGMIYVASSWHHRPHELIQLSIMNNSYNHKYGSSRNNANLNPNRKNDIRDNKNNLRSNANDNGVRKTVRKDDKLAGDIVFHYPKEGRISRGEIGLPMERTPALVGAQPGKIQCDMMNDRHHVLDNLAYWNEPRGDRDRAFIKAPFQYEKATKTQYLTFEPDSGGWNNIRMSMESIFIFAAATGRTLVLPPDQPLYLLKADASKKERGFGDFYDLKNPELLKVVNIISTKEFLELEGGPNGQFPIPEESRDYLMKVSTHCERRAKSNIACKPLWDYYESLPESIVPKVASNQYCVVFGPESKADLEPRYQEKVKTFCDFRKQFYLDESMKKASLLHFKTQQKEYRLMEHFYNLIIFTDPMLDNFYKRFVRDFMHYKDEIFCAAAKVIAALQDEGAELGFPIDEYGAGGYSAYHIRRGDLQYKSVKISAEEWVKNTDSIWENNELLYIATDERNQTFFGPFKESGHTVRFLDDYFEVADLKNVDPNYYGMIDTIVASRGRKFVGTYYSTFSGFINRMRGYHGMSMQHSKYGYLPKYDIMLHWIKSIWMNEFPTGWAGIDGDEEVSSETFAF